MRHHHRTEHTHDNQHAPMRERRCHPPLCSQRPIYLHQKQLIDKGEPNDRNKSNDGTFYLLVGISEKHDDYKYGSQDRTPYDGNVKQHLQSDGTSQYLCQRSRDGSQHCCTQYGTRHPGRSIFGSGFGQAQAGYNAKMRHIMLQYNQHDSG